MTMSATETFSRIPTRNRSRRMSRMYQNVAAIKSNESCCAAARKTGVASSKDEVSKDQLENFELKVCSNRSE